MTQVTVTICTTCRAGQDPDSLDERPGARLLAALAASELPEDVVLRPVQCLSACKRGCAMVVEGGDQRWSYVYGDLNPDTHVPQILDGLSAYAATPDGLVPWRTRPEVFRKQSIARIPPKEAPHV